MALISTEIIVQGEIDCIGHRQLTNCQCRSTGNSDKEVEGCLKTAQKDCRVHKIAKKGPQDAAPDQIGLESALGNKDTTK